MRGDPVGLRIMDMRVDEAGDDQPARMIDDLGPGEARGKRVPIAERDDMAVLDRQQAVVMVQDRRCVRPWRGRAVRSAIRRDGA
jgi:hypothetical protein